jgi:glycosyltransferase involved in cell wall biosynthesis
MRVIALLATYNEERFIGGCIEHLERQGINTYLIDNASSDSTIEIAKSYKSLLGVEILPRDGVYRWQSILRRKEELGSTLDADWFMHVDADERFCPPGSNLTLADAFESISKKGFTAVNFDEFTFIPTVESPNHDHAEFEKTMEWYYYFAPAPNRLMRAWKKQPAIDISSTGGHQIQAPEIKLYPVSFSMKHYLFLSREHAAQKYLSRRFDEAELKNNWHGWRARLTLAAIQLPIEKLLKRIKDNGTLDRSEPWMRHWLDGVLEAQNNADLE